MKHFKKYVGVRGWVLKNTIIFENFQTKMGKVTTSKNLTNILNNWGFAIVGVNSRPH